MLGMLVGDGPPPTRPASKQGKGLGFRISGLGYEFWDLGLGVQNPKP